MPESGFLEQKPRSPTSLVIVVAMHAAAITALALSKMEMPVKVFQPIKIRDIQEQKPPPEKPPEPKQKIEQRQKTVMDTPPRIVPTPPQNEQVSLDTPPVVPPIYDPFPSTGKSAEADPPVRQQPVRDPVRVGAVMDPRSELQPPYPPSAERLGEEGRVVVSVTIGADGRVKAIEKVSATDEDFWRATERHALRHWRFKPATVDGKPVESRKQLTVHFRLA